MTDPISITRVFEAPRERVWREWTEPDRFADWFGGAVGEVAPSSVAMDVRVGGAWRLTMRMRGGESPAQTSAARYGWSRFFDRLAERLAAG